MPQDKHFWIGCWNQRPYRIQPMDHSHWVIIVGWDRRFRLQIFCVEKFKRAKWNFWIEFFRTSLRLFEGISLFEEAYYSFDELLKTEWQKSHFEKPNHHSTMPCRKWRQLVRKECRTMNTARDIFTKFRIGFLFLSWIFYFHLFPIWSNRYKKQGIDIVYLHYQRRGQ